MQLAHSSEHKQHAYLQELSQNIMIGTSKMQLAHSIEPRQQASLQELKENIMIVLCQFVKLYNPENTVLEVVNSTNKSMCQMSREFSVHISDTQLTHQLCRKSPHLPWPIFTTIQILPPDLIWPPHPGDLGFETRGGKRWDEIAENSLRTGAPERF